MPTRCHREKSKTARGNPTTGVLLKKSCNSGVDLPKECAEYRGAKSLSGYKFETLSTLPTTWAETSREFIEDRENHIVNNKGQYCSVVRTGIGSTTLCLGGEVDASKLSVSHFLLKPIA